MTFILKSECKSVLKLLIKLWDKRGDKVTLEDQETLYKKYFSKKFKDYDFYNSLETLIKFNLITCMYGDGLMFFIRITEIGEAYFPTLRHENKQALLSGIVFPVIVAFVTSIITALVTVLIIK